MIKSMTAFGRSKREGAERDITVEIKSVNSRYFDCSVKIPRAFMFLEERIKAYVQKNAVSRAKVDVYVTIEEHQSAAGRVDLDLGYAESYITALRKLGEEFGLHDDITLMRVAANRDIFRTEKAEHDEEQDWQMILPVLGEALDMFIAARATEGTKIEKDIRGKIAGIEKMTPDIAAQSEQDIIARKEKLEERM